MNKLNLSSLENYFNEKMDRSKLRVRLDTWVNESVNSHALIIKLDSESDFITSSTLSSDGENVGYNILNYLESVITPYVYVWSKNCIVCLVQTEDANKSIDIIQTAFSYGWSGETENLKAKYTLVHLNTRRLNHDYFKLKDILNYIMDFRDDLKLDKVYSFRRDIESDYNDFTFYSKYLQTAVAKDGILEVYYQPIKNTVEGNYDRLEALLRLNMIGSDRVIYPDEFFKYVKIQKLEEVVDLYVLNEVCNFIMLFNITQIVHINMSPVTFKSDKLFQSLEKVNSIMKIPYNQLCLELTEGVDIDEPSIIDNIKKIEKLGVQIVLDDFGTGFNSFTNLLELPISGIKVSKEFIDNMKDKKIYNVVDLLIKLGKTYEVPSVAEGVEDEHVKTKLIELGCEYIQGYLYSKPLTALNTVTFLKENQER